MAISKDEWKNHSESDQAKVEAGDESVVVYNELPVFAQKLFDKLNEGLDKVNEHITDVSNMKSDISTNTAKTGITTAQASAITANTAKTGISTSQASQLTAYGKGQMPVGAGTLSISFNAKSSRLTFTYVEGKTTKTGYITLS